MTLQVLVHEDPDGALWAEVPSLPGCYTTGANLEEITENAHEAILAYGPAGAPTSVGMRLPHFSGAPVAHDIPAFLGEPATVDPSIKVLEIAVPSK